ncbi:response regulator transcription factor [Chitinibacter sp. SCUT-21]|uniref:response regulator transcription factor n=1 Tax=Chitinibacter sp. SCUT-21 TaxID=2970891 RepID=UPI0035A6FC98
MTAKILIVEDDAQISANIYDFLSAKGLQPDAAPNAAAALHLLANEHFDLMVLDLGLPGLGGVQLAQHVRQQLKLTLPILILTARDTIEDKQLGFDAGADDYLLKPFSLAELVMRINALLRRAHGRVTSADLRFGALYYTAQTAQFYWQGHALHLPPKTLTLLHILLQKPQTLFTREQLERALWGEVQDTSDALRYHLSQLRKVLTLADGHSPIQTIHGRGYMLVPHEAQSCKE